MTALDEQIERIKRLVPLLEDWARWQSWYSPRVGYPSRVAMLASDASQSFEDMCESMDGNIMQAIEAAVEDLPPAKKAAIHKRYGICAVYRFPRDDYELQLLAAHEELLRTLPKRNVVI